MDVSSVLNIIIIVLLSLISFLGVRLFNTNDKQYALMSKLNETIHKVDKRVIVLETESKTRAS